MSKRKLTPAQAEKAALLKIKSGKSRKTRGAINALERRLKTGGDIRDLEKRLTSKEIKDVFNAVNKRKYGNNYIKISHYYKSTSKYAKSVKGFMAIKLGNGGPKGWISQEGRIWAKTESIDILNSLDGFKGMGRGKWDETLIDKWYRANDIQKAMISQYLADFDWDKVFEELYSSFSTGDQVAERKTFLREVHGEIDKILKT